MRKKSAAVSYVGELGSMRALSHVIEEVREETWTDHLNVENGLNIDKKDFTKLKFSYLAFQA